MAGAAIVLLGWLIAARGESRRRIRFSLRERRHVYSSALVGSETFLLTLDGEPVRELYSIDLEIKNSGNRSLKRGDFRRPPTLVFDKSVKVLPVNTRTKPEGRSVTQETAPHGDTTRVCFQPSILHPGDAITRSLLYEVDGAAAVSLDGRLINGEVECHAEPFEDSVQDFRYRIHPDYDAYKLPTTILVLYVLINGSVYLASIVWPELRDESNPDALSDTGLRVVLLLFAILAIPIGAIVSYLIDRRLRRQIRQEEKKDS